MKSDTVCAEFNERYSPTRLSLARDGDVISVTLNGSLETKAASSLQAIINALIDQLPAGGILALDLSAVQYICSAGVGTLATSLMRAKKKSARFRLVSPSAPVRQILNVLGLTYLFEEGDSDV